MSIDHEDNVRAAQMEVIEIARQARDDAILRIAYATTKEEAAEQFEQYKAAEAHYMQEVIRERLIARTDFEESMRHYMPLPLEDRDWKDLRYYYYNVTGEVRLDDHEVWTGKWEYMTDGPGYQGRVIFILWPGDPSFFQVFIDEYVGSRRILRSVSQGDEMKEMQE